MPALIQRNLLSVDKTLHKGNFKVTVFAGLYEKIVRTRWMVVKSILFFMPESLPIFTFFSSKSSNRKVFTHSDFEIELSFAIIDSIPATTLYFRNNARTWEKTNFIYLSVEKLVNLHLVWNTIRKLQ